MLYRKILAAIHIAGLLPAGYAISSIGVSTAPCKTVAGVVLPTPTGSICGDSGSSYALAGSGTIINYVAGSPYVASVAACSAQCLATDTCSGIYFIAGQHCNLKYGPRAFLKGQGNPPFEFYDATCFTCGSAPPTPTSSICKTVDGVISPTPSSSICGESGSSYTLAGSGTLISYTSGSPYVASVSACSAQCLATDTCSGVYFIQGQYCNLKYGPRAFLSGQGNPPFEFYDATCFKCPEPTICKTVSGVITPTPSNSICNESGSSYTLAGSGTLVSYTSGSPYVASVAACSAQCLATDTCSGVYFIQGQYCNLKYGPRAFLSGQGNPPFQFYDASCFKCPDPPACKTVSGVITPTPDTAICGSSGSSFEMADTGTIIGYGAGTVYVSSIAACSARCLATADCSSIYFIQGQYCNLKYGPRAFLSGQGNPPFQFYETACFKCPASSIVTTPAPSTSTTPTATSISVTTTAACGVVSGLASPAPMGAICGAKGSSYANEGSGTIINYVTGSPYVASIAACGAQCLATSCCTNIYFIKDQYCNLKYGPKAFGVNTGNPQFDFYEASCFTCDRLSCSTTVPNMELTTTFTPPARCTQSGYTQMAYSYNNIWKNAIIPVPSSTITSCFPTQFADSVIASAVSSTILPPFAKLVCPNDWESLYWNSTYLICCPPNFNPYLPNEANLDRPGLDALCTLPIGQDILIDITSYDSTAFATVLATSVPTGGIIVIANAFDGTALNPQPT